MRVTIGLVGLVGLVGLGATFPTPNTPQSLPPNTFLTAALATAGDTIVCQGNPDSGPCETINAQGTCITLGNNAFHKVRNIYQAKGSVCKYFDKDCSAAKPVVSINSNKQNLWLDLEPEIGNRIGLVLCRNDWPKAQQGDAEEEKRGVSLCYFDVAERVHRCDVLKSYAQAEGKSGVVVRSFPPCHFDLEKGQYVCEDCTALPSTKINTAGQFPPCHFDIDKDECVCEDDTASQPDERITPRQLVIPQCYFDVKKGEYVCEDPTAPPNTRITTRQFPPCHFDVKKGEYVCEDSTATPPDTRITTRQFPPCHFDVNKGEYICEDGPLAVTAVPVESTLSTAVGNPTTIQICKLQEGGTACMPLPARDNCQVFPKGWSHAVITVVQEKGSVCWYYDNDCKGSVVNEWSTRDTGLTLGGPGVKAWGAVWCALL